MSHPYETPDPKTHPWTICETCPGDGKHSQHLEAEERAEQRMGA